MSVDVWVTDDGLEVSRATDVFAHSQFCKATGLKFTFVSKSGSKMFCCKALYDDPAEGRLPASYCYDMYAYAFRSMLEKIKEFRA